MIDMDIAADSITILVVSDEEFQRVAESHLTGEWDGVKVLTATGPEEALSQLRDNPVDCLVADAGIPHDGEPFADTIQAEFPNLPVVLRSKSDRPSDPAVLSEPHIDIHWHREGVGALDELAARIATVIAASRTEPGPDRGAESTSQADKIEALHDAANDILTCRSETEVYEQTVAAAERILEMYMCCTMIYDDGMLYPRAVSSGAPPDGARPMQPDEGEAGYVFQTGEPRLTNDSLDDDVVEPAKDTYRSGMSVPIGDVGVFQAVATELGYFSQEDLELTELLLSHTQSALDRIRFDETLQNERDRFQALIENTSDLITVIEQDGTIRYQSPSLERILGYDAQEARGDNVFEFIHPEDRERVRALFDDAVEDPEYVPTMEYRARHSDGGWRILESIGTNRLDDPAVEGFVVNSRDVTERKERLRLLEELPNAARKLRDAETEDEICEIAVHTARSVLGLPITVMWLYDADDDVLRPTAYTPESEELFGTIPTFSPEDQSLTWEAFESGESRTFEDVSQESGVYNPETPLKNELIFPLGRYGVIEIGSTERNGFTDVDIYFARILAATVESALVRLAHQQTLKEQQRELQDRNERLNEFASLVSHDLRNPLEVANAGVELARHEGDTSHIDLVDTALGRMEAIIEDVLTLARQGQPINEMVELSLSSLSHECWGTTVTGNASFEVVSDVTFRADADRLKQLLENLFRNAIEHGGEDVVIRVGAIDSPPGFYVADDGPGVPAEKRSQVFESGYSTASDGTGFGLAIVQEIVEAHDWEVRVTASDQGGARFEITGVDVVS